MCMDPLLTGFYRVSQKVNDIIPVLRLTPIGTQPSAVSVFLALDLEGLHDLKLHHPSSSVATSNQ